MTDQIERAINNVSYSGGRTNFSIPLTFAKDEMFSTRNGGRDYAKKVIVFITDGDARVTEEHGKALRDMHIAVYVVAVGNGVVHNILELIATNLSYIYTVNNYSLIWDIKNSLASRTCKEIIEHHIHHPCTTTDDLCQNGGTCQITGSNSYKCYCVFGYTGNNCQTDINECHNIICQHNGTCIDRVGYFTCVCQTPYSGNHCETNMCDPRTADIVILIDISASMDQTSLDHAAKHVEKTIKDWIIDYDNFQIALVSFSKSSKTIFQFSDITTIPTLLTAVRNMRALNQASDIHQGLFTADSLLLSNGRPNAKKKILLYSDGFPSSPQSVENAVTNLRYHSIELYAVAIGSDVSHYFLSTITGDISRVFPNHSDRLWHHIMKDLISPECNACTTSQESDVVLLVDTTTKSEHLYKTIPSILLKTISKLQIGIQATKVALMTYDQTTSLQFAFDDYSDSNRMDLQRILSSYTPSNDAEADVTNAFMEAVDLLNNIPVGARTTAKKVILFISEFKTRILKIDHQNLLYGPIDVNTIGVIDDEHSFKVISELATSSFHIGITGSFSFNHIDLFIDSFVEQLKTLECRLIS